MSNKTYQTTLLIRGDSKNAVRSVELTRDQLEKLTGAQNRTRTASQQLASAFSKANGIVDRSSRAFQGLGALITGLGIGTAMRTVIQNTGRQQAAITQLEAAIRSTGGAAGRSSQELQDYASSLQQVTTFGDEAIIEMQAMLATFTNIQGVNFDAATKSILDLSQAMGQDLRSSTVQLGKVLNDPVANLGALSRTGIQFGDAQKELIKSLDEAGDRAAAQSVILEELQRQFGGSAEAARTTLPGALKALGNAWGDLFEVQGPVLDDLTGGIGEMEALLTDPSFKQNMQELASAVIRLGTGFAEALQEGVKFAKFLGEELARRINGAAADDIPGMEMEVSRLEQSIKLLNGQVGINGMLTAKTREEIEKKRQKIRQLNLLIEDQRKIQAAANREQREAERQAVNTGNAIDQLTGITVTASRKAKDLSAFSSVLSEVTVTAKRVEKDLGQFTRTAEKEADDFQAAYNRGLERLDDSFADFFQGILENGKVSFDGLKTLFTRTLSEMIVAAVRNPIMIGLGFGGGSSAASAAGAMGGGGLGIGSILGGIGNFGAGAMNAVGQGAAFLGNLGIPGMNALSTGAFQQGMTMTAGGALLGAGAGLAGGFASNAVFGQTSGIGNTLGGLAGFALGGPLGAALGSFAGGGIESLFGSDNNGENSGRARVNLRTGQSNIGGVGRTFDQGRVDEVQGLADFASQVAALIGGSNANLDIVSGRSGIRVGANNFESGDVAGALNRIFVDVVNQSDALTESMKRVLNTFRGTSQEMLQFSEAMISIDRLTSRNPIGEMFRELERGTQTAMGAYREQLSVVDSLRRNFDGSVSAAQQLNAALAQNQQAALQLAGAYQQVSEQARLTGQDAARQIRESVMGEQELRQTRFQERNQLFNSLGQTSGPDELARNLDRIQQLNTQIFQSLANPDRERAEQFAIFAERAAERGADVARRQQEELRKTQQQQNNEINQTLQNFAAQQQRAVQEFGSHVARLGAIVSGLGSSELTP